MLPSLAAVIFDLGGVVFDISFERVFASWGRSAGTDPREVAARFRFDDFYERLERGDISPDQYRAHVVDLLGIPLSRRDFERGWNDLYLEIKPGIDDLLRQLQPRLRLLALTNTNVVHAPVWRVRYASVLSRFERVLCSHEIGARKPEPAAFRAALDVLGLPGRAVMFVDDNPENVSAAARLGLQALLATTASEIAAELRRRGVEIPA